MNTIRYVTESITWLGFFAALFFALFYYLKFRNSERMSMIDKGADVSDIYKKRDFSINFRFPWIRLAWLAIGIGFGVALAYFLDQYFSLREEEMLISSSLLIFGGIGLVLGNRFERKFKLN